MFHWGCRNAGWRLYWHKSAKGNIVISILVFEPCASRTQTRSGNDVQRCLSLRCICKMNFLLSEWTEKISAAAQTALWNLQQSGSNHEEAAQEEQRHYQDRTCNGQGAQGGSLWELCQCKYAVLSVTPLLPHIHVLLTAHIFTPSNPVICFCSLLPSFIPFCLVFFMYFLKVFSFIHPFLFLY
jgi:hypothetical protein